MFAELFKESLVTPAYDLGINMTTTRMRKKRKGCVKHSMKETIVMKSAEMAELSSKVLMRLLTRDY